ncbi:uncharacterized protein LOC126661150 [Mercurialis annua]|uniref:uncharacterized protein LOC126661150 n=1 Tax=Mercurialis annua TaxID=3986 RepID=UPI00215E935C|nr:uncharacterized protein LOC126661150 [Mercurialis annua]
MEKKRETWGTWEELVLACAVKRHGFKNWESVSMELQTATSLPRLLTSADSCRQKYHHRFNEHGDEEEYINKLRKTRVAELKQELHRCDISINCLQLKVKRLEEERVQQQNKIEAEPDKKCSLSGDESDRSVNESNSEVEEGKKPTDEVQSSARNSKRRDEIWLHNKSEPLMQIIRDHRYASLFEGPLETQKTDVYKNTIRQHLDLETIQTRLEQGSYSCSNLLFFRDLLLLFNNAIVFFSQSSNEWSAAYELRSIVSNEIKKETHKSELTATPQDIPPQPKIELERSDSLLAKHKVSALIVVCRKRSSLSAKPSASNIGQNTEQQQLQPPKQQESNENDVPSGPKTPIVEQSSLKIELKEKLVTGTRSSRRSKKNMAISPSKKRNASPSIKVDKLETPKTEKKKTEVVASDKKRSAADFLKRIKKSSPEETAKKNTRTAVDKGKDRALRTKGEVEENSPSKKNVGRPSKVVKLSGKRGRESGGKEAAKRPIKRSRR